MNRYLVIIVAVFFSSIGFAQQGWDWGTDKAVSQNKWFNVVEQVKLKNYAGARADVNWLLTNTPKLNVDLYKQASKIYQTLEKTITDPAEKKVIQDSVLWVYDTRLSFFGDSANVLNRKGLYAYKYKASDPKAYDKLYSLYTKVYQLNGYKTYMQNTLFLMAVASNRIKSKVLDEPTFINTYNLLTEYSKEHITKETTEKSKNKYIKNKDKIDGLFAQSIKMTCDKIKDLYGDKLKDENVDIATAKKVYILLVKAKCTDDEMYKTALTVINKAEPSTNGYIGLADYYQRNKEYAKVDEMYAKALEVTTSEEQKGEVYYTLAKKAKGKKQFSKARDYAMKAISSGAKVSASYTLIGDMYMYNSYNNCKTTDVVISRSVYLVAYEMYQEAGNTTKMETAKKQFPSEQEVFFTNRKVGDTINTGCWVNQNVVIRSR